VYSKYPVKAVLVARLTAVLLVAFSGAAAAGNVLYEPHTQQADDYAAQVYYRLDFGGPSRQFHSVGLRFDRSLHATAAGAPPLLAARFGAQGIERIAVNGVDLRGARLSSGQTYGGGFFSSLTLTQWLGLGATVIVIGVVASDAMDSNGGDGVDIGGTGSSGG
jgi:hypothetical protein